jgi:hypothetical protein
MVAWGSPDPLPGGVLAQALGDTLCCPVWPGAQSLGSGLQQAPCVQRPVLWGALGPRGIGLWGPR